jgi:hypothetical protein
MRLVGRGGIDVRAPRPGTPAIRDQPLFGFGGLCDEPERTCRSRAQTCVFDDAATGSNAGHRSRDHELHGRRSVAGRGRRHTRARAMFSTSTSTPMRGASRARPRSTSRRDACASWPRGASATSISAFSGVRTTYSCGQVAAYVLAKVHRVVSTKRRTSAGKGTGVVAVSMVYLSGMCAAVLCTDDVAAG